MPAPISWRYAAGFELACGPQGRPGTRSAETGALVCWRKFEFIVVFVALLLPGSLGLCLHPQLFAILAAPATLRHQMPGVDVRVTWWVVRGLLRALGQIIQHYLDDSHFLAPKFRLEGNGIRSS